MYGNAYTVGNYKDMIMVDFEFDKKRSYGIPKPPIKIDIETVNRILKFGSIKGVLL